MASKKNRKRKSKKKPQNEAAKTDHKQAETNLQTSELELEKAQAELDKAKAEHEKVAKAVKTRNTAKDDITRVHLILLGLPAYPTLDAYPLETLNAACRLAAATPGHSGFPQALFHVSARRLERLNARNHDDTKGLATSIGDIDAVVKQLQGQEPSHPPKATGLWAPLREMRNRFVVMGFPEVRNVFEYDVQLPELMSQLIEIASPNFFLTLVYVSRAREKRLLDPSRRDTGTGTTLDDLREAINEAKTNPVRGPDGRPLKPPVPGPDIDAEGDFDMLELVACMKAVVQDSHLEARRKEQSLQMAELRRQLLVAGPGSAAADDEDGLWMPAASARSLRSLNEFQEFRDMARVQRKRH